MKKYRYSDLSEKDIRQLVRRNTDPANEIRPVVQEIIDAVVTRGDAAVLGFAEKFDRTPLKKLSVDRAELIRLAAAVTESERSAIRLAHRNITLFHQSQAAREPLVETMPGVTCWRESRPIEKVGLYVPGGSAVLPSTFLMLGIPAKLAGCPEIVVCSPPQKDGTVNRYIAYCAELMGIDRIFLAGGAQAIAAMAYGTESIPKVDKIFGPGNQYVTMAKTVVQANSGTAIDMPAGPSEVLVIADASADPVNVAADLLAQAEHGADSQAVLVTHSDALAEQVLQEVQTQLPLLPRADMAGRALENSYIVITGSTAESMAFSNAYAPEHLLLQTNDCDELSTKVKNAGSVFVGHFTPESAGDYASGTNHTLPTGGFARSYSGVSLDSFVKKITFQRITAEGIRAIGPSVEILAALEGLEAHKNAVSVRLKS